MSKSTPHLFRKPGARWLPAVLGLTLGVSALAQEPGTLKAPPPLDPTHPLRKENANPRLLRHSNYFLESSNSAQAPQPSIYDLRQRHWPLAQYPANLQYQVYSAVGYDLANITLLIGPSGDWVIIDTLGGPTTANTAIEALKKRVYTDPKKPAPAKLPLRAIVYTHNHIDHTGGVRGFLDVADSPPCLPEASKDAGRDGYYNVDTQAKLAGGKRCVAIIGQEKINSAVANTATIVGSAIDPRSAYMYGNTTPEAHINSGIGPAEVAEKGPIGSTYYMPTRTFSQTLNVTAAGINMQLIYSPSETDDELVVFVPDKYNVKGAKVKGTEPDWNKGPGLLQSAETIQGPSFPNLYSLRGTSYRDPSNWYKSLDTMRQLDSWCMVPSHGPPVCEPNNIQLLLTNYRDAIQFTNDQAIRYINQGYTLDELAELPGLQLPSYLVDNLLELKPIQNEGRETPETWVVDPRDYLTFFYGSVAQGVREIYSGKLGWFQGDPVALQPIPKQEAAKRYVALMSGPAKVLEQAKKALDDAKKLKLGTADWRAGVQWSAELSTLVIQAGIKDPNYTTFIKSREKCLSAGDANVNAARKLKAEAMALLAQAELNPNWRNWYAASSRELECALLIDQVAGGLVSVGIIQGLPAQDWIRALSLRLKAEETIKRDVNQALGFFLQEDAGPSAARKLGYVLQIRKAVAQFSETEGTEASVVAKSNVAISLSRVALNNMILIDNGQQPLRNAFKTELEAGRIKLLKGTPEELYAFADNFDAKPIDVPVLSGR